LAKNGDDDRSLIVAVKLFGLQKSAHRVLLRVRESAEVRGNSVLVYCVSREEWDASNAALPPRRHA
jgi:hypothetical protein